MVCPQARPCSEGERVLDVGCGWGSFPLWAATKHGASVVGITLSPPQAEKARQRAEAAGVADRVEIRVMDYRDLRRRALRRDRQHRHGRARRRRPDRRLRARPSPACSSPAGACSTTASPASATPTPRRGRSRSATSSPTPRRCTSRAILLALERAGFVTHHVEDFGADYAETLRHWVRAPRREPRRGGPPRRPRTGPGLAALPARRPQRLRIGLHHHLPGPLRARLTRPAGDVPIVALTPGTSGIQAGKPSSRVASAQSAPASRSSSTE